MLSTACWLLLTIPIFFPVVQGLNLPGIESKYILVWFGIIAVVVTVIGALRQKPVKPGRASGKGCSWF